MPTCNNCKQFAPSKMMESDLLALAHGIMLKPINMTVGRRVVDGEEQPVVITWCEICKKENIATIDSEELPPQHEPDCPVLIAERIKEAGE